MRNSSKKAEMNILLLGTMSSGKTALLNALFGGDYLPSANQATTNKIFLINSSDGRKKIEYKDEKDGRHGVLCGSVSRELNSDGGEGIIHVLTSFEFISDISHSINVFDVPGYNYSGNKEHARILNRVVKENMFTDVFVIIDYTQMFTNDQDDMFRVHIGEVMKNNPDVRLLFILNKIDKEDPCHGDNVAASIQKLDELIRKKINSNNHSILPISALIASVCKKKIFGKNKKNHDFNQNCICYKLTEHEEFLLSLSIDLCDKNYLQRYIKEISVIDGGIFNESVNKGRGLSFAMIIADNIYSLFDKGYRKKVKQVLNESGIGFVEHYMKSRCIQILKQRHIRYMENNHE